MELEVRVAVEGHPDTVAYVPVHSTVRAATAVILDAAGVEVREGYEVVWEDGGLGAQDEPYPPGAEAVEVRATTEYAARTQLARKYGIEITDFVKVYTDSDECYSTDSDDEDESDEGMLVQTRRMAHRVQKLLRLAISNSDVDVLTLILSSGAYRTEVVFSWFQRTGESFEDDAQERGHDHDDEEEEEEEEEGGERNFPAITKFDYSSRTALLLAAGVDPNLFFRDSLLKYLVISGETDTALQLLQHGADPNRDTPGHLTPLMVAVGLRNLPLIHALLQHGADAAAVNEHSRVGHKPMLAYAIVDFRSESDGPVLADQREVCMALLRHGAPLGNCPDGPEGTSPLMYAVKNRKAGVCALLLEHGADPNLASAGVTPMAAAAEKGSIDIMELLAEHGATGLPECECAVIPSDHID